MDLPTIPSESIIPVIQMKQLKDLVQDAAPSPVWELTTQAGLFQAAFLTRLQLPS